MKQSIKLLLVLVIMFSLSGCTKQTINYPDGKDTVEIVGDGRFQLGKFPDHLKLQMFVSNNNFIIIDSHVTKYMMKDQILYVIGDGETYTIVNGQTNTCKQYSASRKRSVNGKEDGDTISYLDSYEDFTDAEKKVFVELK